MLNEKTILGLISLTAQNILLNFIILTAKRFIYLCRYRGIIPTLKLFKVNLNSYYDIELEIAKKKGKENEHTKNGIYFLKNYS